MDEEIYVRQDERTMAAMVHGSILLGVLTSSVGMWLENDVQV
jgi:hypothetical protein